MKPLLLHPSSLFILLLISTNISISLCEDDVRYTNCSNPFRCGSSVSDLKYPFYGVNRDKYCGEEQLKCEDAVPKIAINSIKYRILYWNDAEQILTVARDDYWENNVCLNGPKNSTFDQTPFQYDDDELVNVTLFYDCPPNSPPAIPTTPPIINCSADKVVYSALGTFPLYAGPCTVVVIPIFQTNASLVSSNQISQALNNGFELKWSGNYEQCKSCTDSDGECGFDDGQFQCFCEEFFH